jgi:DNA-binding XRE family transcriptional regulator
MKSITIDNLTDKVVGKIGTPERDEFEYELKMDVLGHVIKDARKKKQLTQSELGKLVGVQKSQISKLENNTKNFRIRTIMKVLDALGAKVKLHVELENKQTLVIN